MRRTALITGASRGLGRALADGSRPTAGTLVVDARDAARPSRSARAADRRRRGPGTVVALPGDIDDPVHVAALVGAAAAQGRLELLVNNAGTLGPSPLPAVAPLRPDDLDARCRTNVVAPLRLIQAALPHLRARRGAVVNVTSDAAVEGYEGWGAYGASKAALEQLSRVLAAEEPDVRVYWVDPGDMRTQMHQDAFPGEDISDRPLPETPGAGLGRAWSSAGRRAGRYRVDDLPEAPTARPCERRWRPADEGPRPGPRHRSGAMRAVGPVPAGRRLGLRPRRAGLPTAAARRRRRPCVPHPRRRRGRDAAPSCARRRARSAPTAGPTSGCWSPAGRRRPSTHRASPTWPTSLDPGDVLVVNTSAVLPAALDATRPRRRARCASTCRPSSPAGSGWSSPAARPGRAPRATTGARRRTWCWRAAAGPTLLAPYPAGTGIRRLWLARLDLPAPTPCATWRPRPADPLRPHRRGAWPIEAYQSVFSRMPGSAEMPSAARPFTDRLVTDLVARGRRWSPVTLHTGVSSQEAGEPPYAERYEVPAATAAVVNAAHADGRRVIAVGHHGGAGAGDRRPTPGRVAPRRGLDRAGRHPRAGRARGRRPAHRLARARVVAPGDARGGRRPGPAGALVRARRSPSGYRWHEFGDSHLILP